ncbi:hypothetical protein CI1B_20910 [Bradyrhizobium ivorense]|uniref:Uncharacterized protein n=1 Tax=Bradyrhizobium ivorense TaxID=2511166 RepID=A0A508T400_9BRAD|nr:MULTISPECIES: hypothetical protein [Bradyrhizobium]QOZ23352.1 hypothetical protein XH93_06610 [Bradyrhizobium sp. CCBAU 51753]VIO68412.1 hypothetical protein CI41S_15010 [Bradyrhizobium ivorense]VIO68474.1 hypothetical protein CI1B_20910 [Bradyrhizobium ivorense]
MPIRPLPPLGIYGDLERARDIMRAWQPLDQLPPDTAEIVAKAIAEGIARGRQHGLEMGQCHRAA